MREPDSKRGPSASAPGPGPRPGVRSGSLGSGTARGRSARIALPILALAVLSLLLLGCEREPRRSVRLDRGTVHVAIAETLDGVPTDVNIAQVLVTRALLHHGFHLAPKESARYLVEGRLDCTYHKALTLTLAGVEQHLEHQWLAEFPLTITDRGPEGAGPVDTESFAFPEPMRNGRTDADLARRDIRRRAATVRAHDVVRGRLLGDPEIRRLLDALLDPGDPRSFEEIESEVVALGARAVPHLLDALLDKRPVRMRGNYPDLEKFEEDQLKVHHLADRMLSVILSRNPGLDLLSTEERRLRVVTAWTWVWEDAQAIPAEYRVEVDARATKVPDTP